MTPTLSAFFRANLSLPLLAFESLAPADIEGPALVELTGPEAPNFLQAMSTNDVLNLPLGAGCEAFFTTATAKVELKGKDLSQKLSVSLTREQGSWKLDSVTARE